MSSSDLSSTRLTASGEIFAGPARLRAIHWVGSGTAGTIEIRDGGAGGTVICTIDTPASANTSDNISLPDLGIRAYNALYLTLTNVAAATVWYS